MMVDYGFYQAVYGGVMPAAQFAVNLPAAEETILVLLCPRLPEDLDPAGQQALKMAVCAQLDSGMDRPVASESVAGNRVQLADSVIRVAGMPVAPGAVSFLRTAGVLQQWV